MLPQVYKPVKVRPQATAPSTMGNSSPSNAYFDTQKSKVPTKARQTPLKQPPAMRTISPTHQRHLIEKYGSPQVGQENNRGVFHSLRFNADGKPMAQSPERNTLPEQRSSKLINGDGSRRPSPAYNTLGSVGASVAQQSIMRYQHRQSNKTLSEYLGKGVQSLRPVIVDRSPKAEGKGAFGGKAFVPRPSDDLSHLIAGNQRLPIAVKSNKLSEIGDSRLHQSVSSVNVLGAGLNDESSIQQTEGSLISSVRQSYDLFNGRGGVSMGALLSKQETNQRIKQIKQRSRQYLRKQHDSRKFNQLSQSHVTNPVPVANSGTRVNNTGVSSSLILSRDRSQSPVIEDSEQVSHQTVSQRVQGQRDAAETSFVKTSMRKIMQSVSVTGGRLSGQVGGPGLSLDQQDEAYTSKNTTKDVLSKIKSHQLSPRGASEKMLFHGVAKTGDRGHRSSALMTIFDDKQYWNKRQAPHMQLLAHEKDRSQGRVFPKSDVSTLPKLRSRASLPENQLSSMNRLEKREMISKLQEEMRVEKSRPETPKTKQIDLEGNATGLSANMREMTLTTMQAEDTSPMTRLIAMQSDDEEEQLPALVHAILGPSKLAGDEIPDDDSADQKQASDSALRVEQMAKKAKGAAQSEDPLAFDMQQVLVFKMPPVTSKAMYHKVDSENPHVNFKDSNYYKQKHHLGGLMGKKSLKDLKKQIRDLGDHRRDIYDLSPDKKKRQKQVASLIQNMDDSIEASRLENLILDERVREQQRQKLGSHPYSHLKLTVKGQKRLDALLGCNRFDSLRDNKD